MVESAGYVRDETDRFPDIPREVTFRRSGGRTTTHVSVVISDLDLERLYDAIYRVHETPDEDVAARHDEEQRRAAETPSVLQGEVRADLSEIPGPHVPCGGGHPAQPPGRGGRGA